MAVEQSANFKIIPDIPGFNILRKSVIDHGRSTLKKSKERDTLRASVSEMRIYNYLWNLSYKHGASGIRCFLFALTFIKNFDKVILLLVSVDKQSLQVAKWRHQERSLPFWQNFLCKFEFLVRKLSFLVRKLSPARIHTLMNHSKIREHYEANERFLESLYNCNMLKSHSRDGFLLLEPPSKKGKFSAKIYLSSANAKNLIEGDFVISYEVNKSVIHFLTFSLCNGKEYGLGDGNIIVIGGLQGCNIEMHALRSAAIADCYDIAPEDILLISVVGLARKLNINFIICVNSQSHIINICGNYAADQRNNITKSYDDFWTRHSAKKWQSFFIIEASDSLIKDSAVEADHKKRKLQKREIKRMMLSIAEGDLATKIA